MPRYFLCSSCIYSILPIKMQKNGQSLLQWRKQTRLLQRKQDACLSGTDFLKALATPVSMIWAEPWWRGKLRTWLVTIACHRLVQVLIQYLTSWADTLKSINVTPEGASPFSAWTVAPLFWRILTLMADLFFSIRKKKICQLLCLLTETAVQRILKRSILGNYTY